MSIELTSSAAELAGAKALGTHLPKHINLDGSVDADHLVVLSNDIGIIYVTSPHEQHVRAFIHKIIERLGANRECSHKLAGVESLAAVIHRASLPELENAVDQ